MAVIHVKGEQEFEEKVLQAAQPVMVDFWAPWCGPCRKLGPEIEAIGETYEGAVVAKVDVDEEPAIAGRYGVMSVPTVIFFKDGKEQNRLVGYRPRREFTNALDALK